MEHFADIALQEMAVGKDILLIVSGENGISERRQPPTGTKARSMSRLALCLVIRNMY